MDPLSQAALGATVGALAGGRQLGVARAAAWGAVAGMLPDADILANVGDDPFFNLRHHRGMTHALWFGPAVGPLLAWPLWRWHRRRGSMVGLAPWVAVMVLALLSHPLLDCFTPYGTQLLTPISQHRFVLPAVPVIDPIYTAVLLLGLVGLLLRSPWARRVLWSALTLSSLYLALGWYCNVVVETRVRTALADQGIAIDRLGVFPTMLQLPLRRVVVISGGEIRISFVSALNNCPIAWGPAGRAPSAVELAHLTRFPDGETFAWFTSNWLAVEEDANGERRYTDLRYGFSTHAGAGLWQVGLTAKGPPTYLQNRPRTDFSAVRELFAAGFGSECRAWFDRAVG